MKLRDLERHLREHGAVVVRDRGNHTVWSRDGHTAPVPRHRAKGILMERNRIDADAAFRLLRDQSQNSGQRVADLASALVSSHLLLVGS